MVCFKFLFKFQLVNIQCNISFRCTNSDSAIKKNKVLPFEMELESMMLGRINLSEKDKYYMISFT